MYVLFVGASFAHLYGNRRLQSPLLKDTASGWRVGSSSRSDRSRSDEEKCGRVAL